MKKITPDPTGIEPGAADAQVEDNRILRQQLLDQAIEVNRLREALLRCEELKLESQQNEAERAELLVQERKLHELKTNFVTLASHEFRTPIGTILMSASLIGRYNGAQDEEKRERHVQRIKSSVFDLTALLTEFLTLSQIEQRLLPNQPNRVDLPTFCGEILDEMRPNIKPDQTITFEHQGGEPSVVMDRSIVKYILINLLSNSSKYSAEGKKIELTTTVMNGQLKIGVRDQGIGVPESDKDKLFSNFFRGRNAIHFQGTGLGLYVVKRYVDLLGGTITFTSQVNEGTEFTVSIPVAQLPA